MPNVSEPSHQPTAAGKGRQAGGPVVIGYKEYIALPDWKVPRLRAKIDTGALTSALDVASYELKEEKGIGLVAHLRLALSKRHPDRMTVVQAPVVRMAVIRNSNGMTEQRPVVETLARLGSITKPIQVTVTNRACMFFRMILGRRALAGDFVVDVSKKYLLRPERSG
jgi:hypothetical protein